MAGQPLFADTIFALSSGALPSGVAVIRLSGPHVRDVLVRLAGGVPEDRRASLRAVRGTRGDLIDRGLVIYFAGPHSFTGEDCCEFHLHGGKAVVIAMLDALGGLPGLRHAEAGEFTRRAFLHGKLDLTGAEALADLISAETETQRRLALENADGAQHRLYSGWRRRLLHARAMLEAELDFSDEADVPGSVADAVWADLAALRGEVASHVSGYQASQVIRDGYRVVLLGRPNAGKSSFINALSGRDVAIVTEIAGTTRDVVEATLVLGGVKVVLTDTAGIRDDAEFVERIGIERARQVARGADLVIEIVASDLDEPVAEPTLVSERIRVRTKVDIEPSSRRADYHHLVSSVTGEGISDLMAEIEERAASSAGGRGGVLPSRRRHVDLLRVGGTHLAAAVERVDAGLELRAEELRLAADSIGRIIGSVETEDVLGAIFSQFCIGK